MYVMVFLFKLKTAYEMGISDWSSDVCSSDLFKVVNDGMGHAAGDHVLRTVADRLRHRVRPGDTVGRFGGDEFVIVCPEISEPAEVIEIAERLRIAFTEPMRVLCHDLVATASSGLDTRNATIQAARWTDV